MTDDLFKRAEPFLNVCGACDLGMPTSCTCPTGDSRPVLLDLVREVERLRAALSAAAGSLTKCSNECREYGDAITMRTLATQLLEAIR